MAKFINGKIDEFVDILDTDGKVKIHSYYAAGREVTKL